MDSDIKQLKSELDYESYKGITTRHMCDCGKNSCRRYKCVECLKLQIDKVEDSQDAYN